MNTSEFKNDPLPPTPFDALVGAKVLVLPDKPQERTQSGIWIPDGVKFKGDRECMFGRVVQIGPGMPTWSTGYKDNRYPMPDVKKGERIAFSAYGLTNVTVDGVKYISVPQECVLAVIEPEDTLHAGQAEPAAQAAREA